MAEHAVEAHHPVHEPPHDDRPDHGDDPHPHRWRILTVSLVIGFMALLDVTIVNVAVPSIRAGLDTSASTVQWVVSGYALTFGLTLVVGGRLGDAYGRRRLMLWGLVAFVASSAAVGLAPTALFVVVARLVQGAAAGFLTPQNSGLIQQLFSGRERGRAFGYFGLTVSLASALGPLIGGLIILAFGEEQGWRYVFLVNVPIGLVALVAVARLVPKRHHEPDRPRQRLDPVGSLLLGAGVVCLLLPLVSVEGGSELPLLLLLLAVPLLWGFVHWERRLRERGGDPLLDVALLRRTPGYANGLAVGTLYFTGFTGVFLTLSVYLQESLGYAPLETALMLTPFAVGSAITAPLAGRVVDDLGRTITVVALGTTMLGLVAAAIVVPGRSGWALAAWLVPAMLVAGLGGGAVVSPNITLSLAEVPPEMGGAAGGALQTGQRIGSAIGAALLMTVYQLVAASSGGGTGERVALLTSVGVLVLAAAMAVRALRTEQQA